MRKLSFFFTFIVLVFAQILIKNYFNFSQYLVLSFLPVMIFFLPIRYSNVVMMLIAFVTGFFVDFLADGQLGLTACSLVPVAFVRNAIIRLVLGEEVFSRGEDVSPRRQGSIRILICTFILTALYFIVFIFVDSAGTRPFGFNLLKASLSIVLSTAVSLFIANLLCSDSESRWK